MLTFDFYEIFFALLILSILLIVSYAIYYAFLKEASNLPEKAQRFFYIFASIAEGLILLGFVIFFLRTLGFI